jgi:hypothetical protein
MSSVLRDGPAPTRRRALLIEDKATVREVLRHHLRGSFQRPLFGGAYHVFVALKPWLIPSLALEDLVLARQQRHTERIAAGLQVRLTDAVGPTPLRFRPASPES